MESNYLCGHLHVDQTIITNKSLSSGWKAFYSVVRETVFQPHILQTGPEEWDKTITQTYRGGLGYKRKGCPMQAVKGHSPRVVTNFRKILLNLCTM